MIRSGLPVPPEELRAVRPPDLDVPLPQLLFYARYVGVADDHAADVDVVPACDDPVDGVGHRLGARRQGIPGQKRRREEPDDQATHPECQRRDRGKHGRVEELADGERDRGEQEDARHRELKPAEDGFHRGDVTDGTDQAEPDGFDVDAAFGRHPTGDDPVDGVEPSRQEQPREPPDHPEQRPHQIRRRVSEEQPSPFRHRRGVAGRPHEQHVRLRREPLEFRAELGGAVQADGSEDVDSRHWRGVPPRRIKTVLGARRAGGLR